MGKLLGSMSCPHCSQPWDYAKYGLTKSEAQIFLKLVSADGRAVEMSRLGDNTAIHMHIHQMRPKINKDYTIENHRHAYSIRRNDT